MPETIGQHLHQARQARSLTIQQVSRATHIKPHYIEALEAGDFNALPSKAHARGFLRSYASFLGLNPQQLLAAMEAVAAQAVEPSHTSVGPAVPPLLMPTAAPVTSAGTPAEILAIFKDVGRKLQLQRELLGLSLEDVERHTRLRKFYLRALEAGDLDNLPSPVQGRGMLKNYATFLGMDPDPLLLRFAEGLQTRLASRQQAARTAAPNGEPRPEDEQPVDRQAASLQHIPQMPPSHSPSMLRRAISGELFLVLALVIFLAGFVVWGAVRIFAMRQDQGTLPTQRSVSEVLHEPVTPSPSPLPATPTVEDVLPFTPASENVEEPGIPAGSEGTAGEAELGSTPGSAPIGGANGRVQVYITVRQRTWLRVLVDGEIQQEGRVSPGSAFEFAGEERVEVFTGSGSALQIFFNGEDLSSIGEFGQVVYLIFTLDGIQTPTATITPTLTATTRSSPTPRGTTRAPTATATP